MNNLILIHVRGKSDKVFTALATRLPTNSDAVILRKGVQVGQLRAFAGREFPHPVLVVVNDQDTARYASVIGAENHKSVILLGGEGFGGKRTDTSSELRPFASPITCTLLPAGTRLAEIGIYRHRDCDMAEAVLRGLKARAKLNPRMFILAEKHSNYLSVYFFEVSEGAEYPQFPEEPRTDIFSPEKILLAAIEELSQGNEGQQALTTAILRASLRAGKDATFIVPLPATVRKILGDEKIRDVVERQMANYEKRGWRFGYSTSLGNHFTRASSPTGEITNGIALFPWPEVEEEFLELSTLNSDEEKREIRTVNLSYRLVSHFWHNWAACSFKYGFNHWNADYLVVAEKEGGEPIRIWFSRDNKSFSPEGLPPSGSRFLDAFDIEGYHLWPDLLNITKITVTAYEGGEPKAQRIWKSENCGVSGESDHE